MDLMKVGVLGTGDAFTLYRNNTSFVVKQNGFSLGIDCPHSYLKLIDKSPIISGIDSINDIIITHLHGDHVSGLDTFLFYKKFIEGKMVNVYMDYDRHASLWEFLKHSLGRNFDEKVKSDSFYNAEHLPRTAGPFTIEARKTKHYIPGTALLISNGNKKVGFSSDTAYDLELIEWLDQAQLIFHETGPAPGHTPLENLSKLPKQIKQKIRLAHYSDDLDVSDCGIVPATENSWYAIKEVDNGM